MAEDTKIILMVGLETLSAPRSREICQAGFTVCIGAGCRESRALIGELLATVQSSCFQRGCPKGR